MSEHDGRVLVCAPRGRDAALAGALLTAEGLAVFAVHDVPALAAAIEEGAGSVIVSEEALTHATLGRLGHLVAAQPAWSDLPFIVLTRSGDSGADDLRRLVAFAPLGNVTFLERPVRKLTLLSSVAAALRARTRQYQVRNELARRERIEYEVRDLNLELQHRVGELQALIDLSPVGIAVAEDRECRTIRVNRAMRDLFGLEHHRWPHGAPPFTLRRDGHEVSGESFPFSLGETCTSSFENVETEVLFADGRRKTVLSSARPLYTATGEVRGGIGVSTDITERKETERELREAARRKDEFLATLAHELRNPLAPIRYALQVTRASGDRPTREQARAVMERQVAHMVRLIDDLLDVSRITSGKLLLQKSSVSLREVVNTAVETSRPLMEAGGHHLQLALGDEPVVLDADLTRLAQVFANLLNNAARYSAPGSTITVAASRSEARVEVAVRDTGYGIPAEMLSRVFDSFTQVDRSPDVPRSGLGIGLTLVKRLVELHGGSVEARSEGPGRGSEFIVRLPLAGEPAPQPARPPAAAGDRAAARRRRVLIVDDNRDAADSLALVLEGRGHDVAVAYGGPDALRAAEARAPDVVVLDIGMPVMDGYEVARRLRARPDARAIVLVAVTGWGQQEDRLRAREAGFDHHLTKPVDPSELETVVDGPRPVNPAAAS